MGAERNILVVDDDPDSQAIIAEALRWEGYHIAVSSNGREALNYLKKDKFDLVILDMNMPDMNGLQILTDLRKSDAYVSVVFISGSNSPESIIQGLDTGADDYIAKPFDPLELLARIRAQLRIKDLNDQLRTANEKLKELVDIDDLTGLYNMRSIYQKLDFELDRARRFGRQVAVIMMDMDYFKSVNDGHDHLFGSFVLKEVGGIIRKNVRNIDLGARYGGDEFMIVLTELNCEGAMAFCERLRKTIAQYLFKNGEDEIRLTASLGFAITASNDAGIGSLNLVKVADAALYEAKNAGRNCVRFFELDQHGNKLPPIKK